MKPSTRAVAAISALVALEGAIVLVALGLHGGLSWDDVAGTLGLVVVTALIAGLAMRLSTP